MQLSYVLSFPHDVRYVSVVRRLAVTTLTELEVDAGCVDDIALAVTEACTNVVQHGEQSSDLEVDISIDGSSCRIAVRDSGAPFDVRPAAVAADGTAASTGSEGEPLTHGRGIGLMQLLVDQLHYVPDATGTTVVLLKQLVLRPGSVLTDL